MKDSKVWWFARLRKKKEEEREREGGVNKTRVTVSSTQVWTELEREMSSSNFTVSFPLHCHTHRLLWIFSNLCCNTRTPSIQTFSVLFTYCFSNTTTYFYWSDSRGKKDKDYEEIKREVTSVVRDWEDSDCRLRIPCHSLTTLTNQLQETYPREQKPSTSSTGKGGKIEVRQQEWAERRRSF